jgi:hypothetical protein
LFEIVLLKKGLAIASGLAPLSFVMHKKDGLHKLGREQGDFEVPTPKKENMII